MKWELVFRFGKPMSMRRVTALPSLEENYTRASTIELGTNYTGLTGYYFRMESFIATNMTVAQNQALQLRGSTCWITKVSPTHHGITLLITSIAVPQEYIGGTVVKTASRLMPRSVFQDNTLHQRTFAAHKDGVEKGLFTGFQISGTGTAINPTPGHCNSSRLA
ncbi:hypothetical protein BDV28DRAFT_7130 [Aspergillus coremiiformis]|uniref:Uncharacterized protein n=1 Tax=Aspergillus coremiiformis TaxID=138285 RepID=A0A5N6ZFP4_9EURO|nr:hypothetical protein BDV28DRAFT_7130 [Aspergillus coremiiformis]